MSTSSSLSIVFMDEFKSSEMKTKRFLWASLLAVLLLSSCASRKSFVYLNDMDMGVEYQFDVKKEAVVHRDDRLSITVSCKNPELAIPFNMQGGNFHIGADGNVVSSDISSGVREKGYRVDVDGNIDFPILGTLHVEGLKVSELTDLIKRRIIEGNYIKDPLLASLFTSGTLVQFNIDNENYQTLNYLYRGLGVMPLYGSEEMELWREVEFDGSAVHKFRITMRDVQAKNLASYHLRLDYVEFIPIE